MTDQEINLFYAKYLFGEKSAQAIKCSDNAVAVLGYGNYPIDSPLCPTEWEHSKTGCWGWFSPARDANDRDLVFDKLIKEKLWVKYDATGSGKRVSAHVWHPEFSFIVYENTLQEANRAVLEKFMNIINGSD